MYRRVFPRVSPAVIMSLETTPLKPVLGEARGPIVCRAGLQLSHPRRQRRLCGWWGDNLVIKRFPDLMRT